MGVNLGFQNASHFAKFTTRACSRQLGISKCIAFCQIYDKSLLAAVGHFKMHRILPNLRQELARGSWAFKMHRILPNLRQELARGSEVEIP